MDFKKNKIIAGRTKEEWDMLIKLEMRERERCKILGRDYDDLLGNNY